METPLSSRRVTRSQTLAASNNGIPVSKVKTEGSEKSASKTRTRNGKQQQQEEERSALIDITNDSPIVGVAMKTPSSAVVGKCKTNMMTMMTPGSGEALLRGQVKTLLQKVEEEAEVSKIPLESRPFVHLQSPMALVAPTPANTPQVPNLSEDGGLGSMLMDLPVVEEELNISEMASANIEGQICAITRSLLLDFAEKSECRSDNGVIIEDSSASKEKTLAFHNDDIDSASIWSIQVNASAQDEDEDKETLEEMGDEYYDHEEDGLVDKLCKGISKISITEMFTGKHTRFLYDSDDEIGEEESGENWEFYSSDIMRLKGLPTPKGKHLRFPLEKDEQDCE
ncbi:Guanine nucleotide exchange factor SDC25 [Gossypium australe]|uniref:Guanine nucleotide exchange factor SDC25 n=1 Tax=Gossypium australe TaxID=47621 RepID=A0A5B6VZQ5_9ROSI|nr:Guanine nucleotide exchange factor SDC25 [Gossypium australe]